MYLRNLYESLAVVDDAPWQHLLERHAFWRAPGFCLDDEHQGLGFHILVHEGELARGLRPGSAAFEFDAVAIPDEAFADSQLAGLTDQWSRMHGFNFGPGLTTKMGLYVIRAGGTLGFHVDGPVFLNGMRVDLGVAATQRGLIEVQASHRTVLPLRFNPEDEFMVCNLKAPLKRGELFEFNNVLPHAYFNRGREHAVLLVTTYLQEDLLPQDYVYTT